MRQADLAHGLGVDEVVVAPDTGVVVVLPLSVHVEVGEVVALGHRKLLPDLVALLLATLCGGGQAQGGRGVLEFRYDDPPWGPNQFSIDHSPKEPPGCRKRSLLF